MISVVNIGVGELKGTGSIYDIPTVTAMLQDLIVMDEQTRQPFVKSMLFREHYDEKTGDHVLLLFDCANEKSYVIHNWTEIPQQ